MSGAPLLDLIERRKWWNRHGTLDRLDCPCCGYPTLGGRGEFQICSICWWEDDGQDDESAERINDGPNRSYSLTEGRLNFGEYLCQYRPSDSRFKKQQIEELLTLKRELIQYYDNAMEENSFDATDFRAFIKKMEKIYFGKK